MTESSVIVRPEPKTVIIRTEESTIVLPGPERTRVISTSSVGRQGPPGDPATGAYRHTQSTPSAVWTVQHGLGFYPAGILAFAEISPGEFRRVEGEPTQVSTGILLLTFDEPISGFVDVS